MGQIVTNTRDIFLKFCLASHVSDSKWKGVTLDLEAHFIDLMFVGQKQSSLSDS